MKKDESMSVWFSERKKIMHSCTMRVRTHSASSSSDSTLNFKCMYYVGCVSFITATLHLTKFISLG